MNWTTEKEIFYLTYECGLMREPPRMSRYKHLLAYRDAMKLRDDWGTLKPVIIAEHVNMLINKIVLRAFTLEQPSLLQKGGQTSCQRR